MLWQPGGRDLAGVDEEGVRGGEKRFIVEYNSELVLRIGNGLELNCVKAAGLNSGAILMILCSRPRQNCTTFTSGAEKYKYIIMLS